jgi:predicted transcriptional regulator
MVKVTFTVDEETVETLRRIAARQNRPQSAVFREAVKNYAESADRLNDDERRHMLAVLDRVRNRRPSRTDSEVKAEIAAIRADRRKGGRRTPVE